MFHHSYEHHSRTEPLLEKRRKWVQFILDVEEIRLDFVLAEELPENVIPFPIRVEPDDIVA